MCKRPSIRIQLPAAMDPDGDTLTYTMEGTDAASFVFDASTRQFATKAGVIYDYEAKQRYSLRLKADDGRGGTDAIGFAVNVRDVAEPPSAPAVTAVNPAPGSNTSLGVSWTAPDNTGKPAITGYDLRYRAGSAGDWIDGPQDVSGTSSQLTGLESGMPYQVQVRAVNDEGDGDWSNARSGTTSGSSTTPVATFDSPVSTAGEDAGMHSVSFSLSPPPASDITVMLSRSGTASAGQDYGPLDLDVDVAAGMASVDVPVSITDDTEDEGSETLVLMLTDGTGYTVGTASVHTLTITDNDDPLADTPVVSVSGGPAVTEGGAATFTLTASPVPTGSIAVSVTVSDSGDFADGGTGSRTVTVGTSGTASFSVATVDDDADEPDGRITATVGAGTGYSPHGTAGSASVPVRDNDGGDGGGNGGGGGGTPPPLPVLPEATLVPLAGRVSEDAGTVEAVVLLDPAPASALTLRYALSGTAVQGEDYVLRDAEPGLLRVAAGSGRAAIRVSVVDDGLAEGDETLVIGLLSGSGYEVGDPGSAELVIADNDRPEASFVRGASRVAEHGGAVQVEVAVDPPPSERLLVEYWLHADGTAVHGAGREEGHGHDYRIAGVSGGRGLLEVDAGMPVAVILLEVHDDGHEEGDETVVLSLLSGEGHGVGAEGRHTVTIVDNDGASGAAGRPVLSGWLSRLGGTLAGSVLDALGERVDGMGVSGSGGTVAGVPLPSGPASPAPSRGDESSGFRGVEWRDLSPQWGALVSGTSFGADRTVPGGRSGFWVRGSQDRFGGSAGGAAVSGETVALMAGRDAERVSAAGRMLLGGMLVHSRSRGSLSGQEVDAELVSLVPYGALEPGPHLRVWGLLGAGSGEARVSRAGGVREVSDTGWRMAGAGFRRLLSGTAGGMDLWMRGDVRYSRTSADLSSAAASGSALQSRLGLGGEWAPRVIGAKRGPQGSRGVSSWQPRWSLVLRHDGGDAEPGFGAEAGAGVDWRLAGGLSAGVGIRGLAVRGDGGFRDRGVSASLQYDPLPDTARGFRGSFGLDAGNGTLDDGADPGRLSASPSLSVVPQSRTGWRAEGAWGLYRHGYGLLGSPYLSLSGSGGPEAVRMGYRMSPDSPGSPDLELDFFILREDAGREFASGTAGMVLQMQW
ncbi:MAG: hypothetical protein F4X92_04390 [Gammaproteobacteria bacterium]|nr:hypothetical protein [Gammaproteobacteria bacterium]